MPRARQKFTLAIAVSFVAITIAQGCMQTGAAPEEDEVSKTESAIFSQYLWSIFDTNSINVCFQPRTPSDLADPSWTAFTTQIRTVIEGAYEVAGDGVGLNLTGWNLCQNSAQYKVGNESATTIQIMVDMVGKGAATRYCPPNTPATVAVNCNGGQGSRTVLLLGPFYSPLVTAILHEFAHGLGFQHEFDRADNVGSCQGGSNTVDGVYITEYDPNSILDGTYCGNAQTTLSAHDQLGLEIVYPASTAHALRVTTGMVVANGALLARRDSTVTDEWTARGAHLEAVLGGYWTSNGANLTDPEDYVVSLSGLDFTSTAKPVIKTFDTFLGVTHTAEAQILTNDNLHTALVMSAVYNGS